MCYEIHCFFPPKEKVYTFINTYLQVIIYGHLSSILRPSIADVAWSTSVQTKKKKFEFLKEIKNAFGFISPHPAHFSLPLPLTSLSVPTTPTRSDQMPPASRRLSLSPSVAPLSLPLHRVSLSHSSERSLATHLGRKERCSPATQGVLFSDNPNGNTCFSVWVFFFILFGYVGEGIIVGFVMFWCLVFSGSNHSADLAMAKTSFKLEHLLGSFSFSFLFFFFL
jgi:hypothetical protein